MSFKEKITLDAARSSNIFLQPKDAQEREHIIRECERLGFKRASKWKAKLEKDPTAPIYLYLDTYSNELPEYLYGRGIARAEIEQLRDDYRSPAEKALDARFNAVAERQAALESRLELIEKHLAVIAEAMAPKKVEKPLLCTPFPAGGP